MRRIISISDGKVQTISTKGRYSSSSNSKYSLEYLQHRSKVILLESMAKNTKLTYVTAIKAFEKFRSQFELNTDWPASKEQVIYFITYCFERGLSPRTINTYISGLSCYHRLNSWESLLDNFLIKKLLEGCKRLKQRKDNRAPITKSILKKICSNLGKICYNKYEESLFKAAFTLAYFGLFRISEIVSNSNADSDNQHCLQIQDIYIQDGHKMKITLYRSKTNQMGVPIHFKLPREEDNSICPVKAMIDYCEIRPKITGALFCHSDKTVLTRYQFASVLKRIISFIKGAHGKFRTHSFRIGRATDLAQLGLPYESIMKLGRWHSNAYRAYLR